MNLKHLFVAAPAALLVRVAMPEDQAVKKHRQPVGFKASLKESVVGRKAR